ncbi:phosphotriesterase family protein [Microtetraspora malaysiensis]|uniref:phosphotriesterase family protein n=1 Tax=Microtetraspora malaysiensis TaxID=161358 RepID=UPI003D8DCAD8
MSNDATVMTIGGPLPASDLGITLMHEHLFINQMREQRRTGLVNDLNMIRHEVGRFVTAGGGTIVELTVAELADGAAPDPAGAHTREQAGTGCSSGSTRPIANVTALAEVAARTGVHLVLGTGHYRDPYLDKEWFDRHCADRIADELVRDISEGIPETGGVRAGIIGEIGADKWYLSAAEERSFRAAARAHRRTGVPITTHAARWPVGLTQLDLLCGEEEVPPDRVIIGHVDTVKAPLEYALELARRGAWVQFDNLRSRRPEDLDHLASRVLGFARAGRLDQLLLSHDLCTTADWPDEGGVGLTHLLTTVKRHLTAAGLDEKEFDQLLIDNPRRALSGT